MIVNLLAWVLLGLIAGWIANLIVPEVTGAGIWSNVVVGIIGAIVGGFVFQALGGPGISGPFSFYSILVAIAGAAILLSLAKMLQTRA
ncbi:MAG: Transglycosylase-associated protein [candidate division CPR2 bacterium GW2011_GWC1_39_9]|uniref:Transglycosylase-associated protein n=1 Tax=candidate division CPR2 bacterium GW2011_GWC2_39_10 TaxID=1618345 RepID=A0A0G0PZF6_UNCC2|nr:MAG: Transglycosylase-associated protein [candidate division CPR2 bacterium GW2011_GWC2_39_10]KKR34140.1 MAG: Transglycosylase-associated protein [candidate division CPR2 bacterium GW2011_GWC1_39_9]